MRSSRGQLWAVVLALGLVAGCTKKPVETEKKEQGQDQADHDARLVENSCQPIYVTAEANDDGECGDSWEAACSFAAAFKRVEKLASAMELPEAQEEVSTDEEASTSSSASDDSEEEGKGKHKKGKKTKGCFYVALAGGEYLVSEPTFLSMNTSHMRKLHIVGHKKGEELLFPQPKPVSGEQEEDNEATSKLEEDSDSRAVLKSRTKNQPMLSVDMSNGNRPYFVSLRNLKITGHDAPTSALQIKAGKLSKVDFEGVVLQDNKTLAYIPTRVIDLEDNTRNTEVLNVTSFPLIDIQSSGAVGLHGILVKDNKMELASAVSVVGLSTSDNSLRLVPSESSPDRITGTLVVKDSTFAGNESLSVTVSKGHGLSGIQYFLSQKDQAGEWGDLVLPLAEGKLIFLPQTSSALESGGKLAMEEVKFEGNKTYGVAYKKADETVWARGGLDGSTSVLRKSQIRRLKNVTFSGNTIECQPVSPLGYDRLFTGTWSFVPGGEVTTIATDGVFQENLVRKGYKQPVRFIEVAPNQQSPISTVDDISMKRASFYKAIKKVLVEDTIAMDVPYSMVGILSRALGVSQFMQLGEFSSAYIGSL